MTDALSPGEKPRKPTHEDTMWTSGLYSETQNTGRHRACAACGGKTTQTHSDSSAEDEYDNTLVLDITGGYGQFIDIDAYTVVLCHDCAHETCDLLPWLKALIRPEKSHSHTQSYMTANPHHYGWDYDMANGVYFERRRLELFPDGKCLSCGHDESEHSQRESQALWDCKENCGLNLGCFFEE